MHALLSAAGRAFWRVFVAALITLAPGILAAPDLHSAVLVGVAALMASIAAGLRALQAYIPKLSFDTYVGPALGRYLDAFAQALLGALVVSIPALLNYPDQGNWDALYTGLIVAGLAALARAVQALGQIGETVTDPHATGSSGIAEPKNP